MATRWVSEARNTDNNISTLRIQLRDIKNIQKNGRFQLSVPGEAEVYTAEFRHVRYDDDDNYYWNGVIINTKKQAQGDFSLTRTNGNYYAEFKIGLRDFTIEDLSVENGAQFKNQYLYLVEKNSEELDKAICATQPEESTQEREDDINILSKEKSSNLNLCPIRVRILVLYTPAAAAATGNINSKIDGFMNDLNSALANTQVGQNKLYFQLAHKELYTGVNDQTGTLEGLRNHISTNSTVATKRAQHYADIVVLVSNHPDQQVYGVANQPGTLGDYNSTIAHAVVQVNHTGRFTFAHEVAHIMGCRHDDEQEGLTAPHGAARGKIVTVCGRSTIMALHTTTTPRINYFSNPAMFVPQEFCGGDNIPSGDRRLGTLNSRNNFHMLANYQAQTVANYQIGADPVAVAISGNSIIYDNFNYTWCASLTCGNTPNVGTTYQWSWSPDGFTYYILGNTECITRTPAFFNVNNAFITLKVVATSEGGTASSTMSVYVSPGTIAARSSDIYKKAQIPTQTHYYIFPNPASTASKLMLSLAQENNLTINIYGSDGRWEQRIVQDRTFPAGEHAIDLPLDHTATGFKLITIEDGFSNETIPLIIRSN